MKRLRTVLPALLASLLLACVWQPDRLAPHSEKQDTRQLSVSNLEIPVRYQTPGEATPEATAEPAPPDAIGPFDIPLGYNPLTGELIPDPETLNRRPIVVKISNAPPLVRPQSGIGAADVVFEHYAEGGLTRFSAVFFGNAPERVGSIRSARLIDYELVTMFQGMLAFSGASIGVEKVIYGWENVAERIPGSEAVAPLVPLPPSSFAERAYMGVLYGRPYYWRDESIPVPHNMFVNTAALWQLAAEEGFAQRPVLEGMAFAPQPYATPDGTTSAIDIRYRTTRIRWEYDAESGRYLRFADGQAHADANTGEQISAANVVIIYVLHRDSDIVESRFEDAVSWSTEIVLRGEGDAVLFRDGQTFTGTWVRADQDDEGQWTRTEQDGDLLGLRTPDGQILYLKPGNTFFQLMPLPEQLDPEEEGVAVEP